MTLDDLIKECGTRYQIAKKYRFSHNTVRNWHRLGYIPLFGQAKIHLLSGGKYKLSWTKELDT
jgi:hypothetical protein